MATKAIVQPRTPEGHAALMAISHDWIDAWRAEVDAGALEALKKAIDNGAIVVLSTPQGEKGAK